MRDESSMFLHTMWTSYITRSRFSCWFRIYTWLTLFQQDIIMIFQKNIFPGCLQQKFCLLVLTGSALQPLNKGRIYFCLCLLMGVHSYFDVRAPTSKQRQKCINTRLQNKTTHAFKTNQSTPSKQTKKIDFQGFPATPQTVSDWLKENYYSMALPKNKK